MSTQSVNGRVWLFPLEDGLESLGGMKILRHCVVEVGGGVVESKSDGVNTLLASKG